MQLLALDIATNCGIAFGSTSGGDLRAWSQYLGEPPDDRRLSQMARLMVALIDRFNPDLIAGETPIGGKTKDDYLIGLAAVARAMAWNRGVRYESANIATVRKHFCGRAWSTRDFPGMNRPMAKRAIKAKVVARCRILGIEVENDDAADAAAIHQWASSALCGALAVVPGELFHQTAR